MEFVNLASPFFLNFPLKNNFATIHFLYNKILAKTRKLMGSEKDRGIVQEAPAAKCDYSKTSNGVKSTKTAHDISQKEMQTIA